MTLSKLIPFHSIEWNHIHEESSSGLKGTRTTKTIDFGNIRLKLIEYSSKYQSDNWCEYGHIVYCLEGEIEIQPKKGKNIAVRKGMSYFVSEHQNAILTNSKTGATVLMIDGPFLL